MKTIAIIENDYSSMRHSFEYVNEKYFSKQLNFNSYLSVGKKTNYATIAEADMILVDILLGDGSEHDGYHVIKTLLEFKGTLPKIKIITGNSLIEDSLVERKLPKVPYLIKPLRIDELKKIFGELFKSKR